MFLTSCRVFLVIVASLLFLDTAAACTCSGPRQQTGFHPCTTYWKADAVFTGLVEEVSSVPRTTNGKPSVFNEPVVRLSVAEAFRGVEGPTVEIASFSSCGFPFKQGQRYFVYATRRKEDGKLSEWLCGPSVPLELAARDLAYAREMMRGESGSRIVGAVLRYEPPGVKDSAKQIPMPGIEVTLERRNEPGQTPLKTKTNSDGRYEFRGLDHGGYRVRAALPTELREWSPLENPIAHYVALREDGRCQSDSFVVTTSSSIKGRLAAAEGAPLPQQYLSLVPIDEKGREASSPNSPAVDSYRDNGGYFFRDVPSGRYLLIVNPHNKPAKDYPAYPRMYYPGVMSSDQATVVVVPQSRELNLIDFLLPPPLKERWFSGVVLFADRSPAAGARIILIDPNDRMTQTNVTEVIADEQGRFRVKGFETFPYWIDAWIDTKSNPRYAPPVKLPTSGSVDGLELIISLSSRAQPYH